jgi:hypothetical protein
MNINFDPAKERIKRSAGAKALKLISTSSGTLRLRSGQAKSRALIQDLPMSRNLYGRRSYVDIHLLKKLQCFRGYSAALGLSARISSKNGVLFFCTHSAA